MITVFRIGLAVLCSFLAVILTFEVKTTRTFYARNYWAAGSEKSSHNDNNNDDALQVLNCQTTTTNDLWASEHDFFDGSSGDSSSSDPGIAHTLSLTRPRPRNLRLAFLGDSVTRYQYLSLAYFLRWGRWFDPDTIQNHLVDAHSFRHPYHPDQDWNEFFLQSNRLLYPAESCDCQRSLRKHSWAVERRYFYDPVNNNTLTYINLSGNQTHNPAGGYAGRLHAPDIFTNFKNYVGLPNGLNNDDANANNNNSTNNADTDSTTIISIPTSNRSWDYPTWAKVVSHHVAALVPKPETAILNAGLHAHNFGSNGNVERDELARALGASNIKGIWKTTTFKKSQLVALMNSSSNSNNLHVRRTDKKMCKQLSGCFNLSWTANLRPDLYFDEFHFREPVYRILNEDLLEQLNKLPKNYQKLERSTVLR
jgi:hypothetical protein